MLTVSGLKPQTSTDWLEDCEVSVIVAVFGNVPQVAVGAVIVREYVNTVVAAGALIAPNAPAKESFTWSVPNVYPAVPEAVLVDVCAAVASHVAVAVFVPLADPGVPLKLQL